MPRLQARATVPDSKSRRLDFSAIGGGLIGVDGLVGLITVEIVGNKLLDAGETGRATDEHNFVDMGLVDLGIRQDAVHRLQGGAEQVLAQLLKASTSDRGVEKVFWHSFW